MHNHMRRPMYACIYVCIYIYIYIYMDNWICLNWSMQLGTFFEWMYVCSHIIF